MFGIGFTEILLISIIAILFIGPDKLPGAIVDIGKFIKNVKKTVSDAKNSLEEEMQISDLKEEALNYKKQLTQATDELKGFKNLDFDDNYDIDYDDEDDHHDDDHHEKKTTQIEAKQEENLAIKKKPKNKKNKSDA